MNDALPRTFGRYVLHAVVGSGGMATVYRAELHGPAGFRKTVAIKVAKGSPGPCPDVPELYGEGCIGGRLRHRHVIDVYEVGEEDGQSYIAMEYVGGVSLNRLLRTHGRFPPSVSMEIAVAIVRGLRAAHELQQGDQSVGIVHRDIKPSNVLVSWDGEVKIADFGVATWNRPEQADGAAQPLAGTPRYMSPEQAQSGVVDLRSDLFSLGIVLGELVLGESQARPTVDGHPWADPDHPQVVAMDAVVSGFGAVVCRCLQADPEDRYPSARAVLMALVQIQEDLTVNPRLEVWLSVAAASHSEGAKRTPAPVAAGIHMWRTRLPLPEDTFVGRRGWVEKLEAELRHPGQLVSLVGHGGIGKTRLALEFARLSVDVCARSTWFCDLSQAHTVDDILSAVSALLDLKPRGGAQERIAQVGLALRRLGDSVWILDNLEQIVEPVSMLLKAWRVLAPELAFLCTSREPLHLPAEQVIELGPWAMGDGGRPCSPALPRASTPPRRGRWDAAGSGWPCRL